MFSFDRDISSNLVCLKAIVSTQENYPWIWNAQENCSLSCELWVGTNDFNTKKNVLVRSNPRIIFLSGNKLKVSCEI